jgi:hypothetical protein
MASATQCRRQFFEFEARWIHRRPTSVVEIHAPDYAIFAPVPVARDLEFAG